VDKILPAMLEAQKVIRHATKDSENPHFHSSYASLNAVIDECKKPYNDNGIVLIQGTGGVDMAVVVSTRLAHVSGQWYECAVTLEPEKKGPQPLGSVITYGRRYTLQTLACMGAEDDDGNAGQVAAVAKPAKQAPPAADRAKSIREFGKEWDKTIPEVEDGDEADVRRNLEHYFIYVKAGDRAMTFDPKHDYMRPLKAEAIDTLTGILKSKRAEVVGWLETDDVREAVGLTKLSVQGCTVCGAALTDTDKASCAIAGLKGDYCAKHAGEALAKKMKGATNEG